MDVNNFEAVGNAYASVFQVHIHIRRFETQGEQTHIFYAPNVKTSERHIILFLENQDNVYDHCHAVTHIRDWVKSRKTAARMKVTGYCDYWCDSKSSNNITVSKSIQYINQCRRSFSQWQCKHGDVMLHCITPTRFSYIQKDNAYQCNLCTHASSYHKTTHSRFPNLCFRC